jgi:hypothetical protein
MTPAAAVFDFEKLLWIPGEKTIFVPPVADALTFVPLEYYKSVMMDVVFMRNPVYAYLTKAMARSSVEISRSIQEPLFHHV